MILRGVSAGNWRAGIYYDNGDTPVGGALIVESASVAKGGINQKQEITIADTQLVPGLYWIAIISDEGLTTYARASIESVRGGTLTGYDFAQAYGALTDPCPASAAEVEQPILWLRVSSVP